MTSRETSSLLFSTDSEDILPVQPPEISVLDIGRRSFLRVPFLSEEEFQGDVQKTAGKGLLCKLRESTLDDPFQYFFTSLTVTPPEVVPEVISRSLL